MSSAELKRRLEVEGQENSAIKLYRNFEIVGKEMKNDFFASKNTMKAGKDRFQFKMSADNEEEGILGLSYGTFLVSSLLDRYGINDDFTEKEKERLKKSVLKLLDYADERGFDISPYGNDNLNREFFGVDKDSFIESLTWTMSCFLYARRMHFNGLINFANCMQELAMNVARCLHILLANVIHLDGSVGYKEGKNDYIGWGPVTGCTEYSLYFTHSVCETFGDIEDTIIGNEAISFYGDTEFRMMVNDAYKKMYQNGKKSDLTKITDVIDYFSTVCKNVGKNLYEKYKDKLGKKFFYANGAEVTSTEQIAYSIQSPVLLNQLYVVLSIVYVNYYKELEAQDKKAYDEFCSTLKKSVDMVYETYEELKEKGRESIVNREYTTFSEAHRNKEIGQKLSSVRINVAILETLIIKAKTMVVTYVTQYPEKEIGKLLNILDENASENSRWLWSKNGYDLQFTERSISAIREFYDYYEEYQKVYAEISAKENNREAVLLEQINSLKESLKTVKSNHEVQIKELRSKHEEKLVEQAEEIRNGYKLESVVREIVAEQVRESLTDTMVESINNIAESNKKNGKTVLSENNQKVKDAVENMMKSYLYLFTDRKSLPSGINADWEPEIIVDTLVNDMKAFVLEWLTKTVTLNSPNREQERFILSEMVTDKNRED